MERIARTDPAVKAAYATNVATLLKSGDIRITLLIIFAKAVAAWTAVVLQESIRVGEISIRTVDPEKMGTIEECRVISQQ